MRRLVLLVANMPAQHVKRVLILSIFACAGTISLLHAQVSTSNSFPASNDTAKSLQWNRSMLDPFQPGPNFGKFPVTASGGTGFTGSATSFAMGRQGRGRFDYGPQPMGGFNRFDSAGMGTRFGIVTPAFPASNLKPDLSIGPTGRLGAASATLPSLNDLVRGSSSLHMNSSFGSQRFAYKDAFRPIGNLGDLGLPSSSALFTSSDLGNGVFLSAGTGYGSRSAAGAPAASIGNGTSGAAKHSGTAVNLKLSF
jgi:hypothetical protein